jgi:hypothetical protein
MRKKDYVITLIALGISGMVNGVSAQYEYQWGIEVSPQLCWLINKDDMNSKIFKPQSTIGGAFGLMYEYDFTKYIGIGVDALYSSQGQSYQFVGVEFFRKVNYYKVPVMFCYSPELSQGLRLIGKAGPQVSVLSSAELVNKDGKPVVKDQKKAYQDNDYGLAFLGGFGFNIWSRLYTDVLLRYDYSFSNAENSNNTKNINNPNPPFLPGSQLEPHVRAFSHNKTIGITLVFRYCYN